VSIASKFLRQTPAPLVLGTVIGHAGGSLTGAGTTWAKNDAVARIGKTGEIRTAAILDPLTRQLGGPTVLHDLLIPIPGYTANIDHVLISGRTVHIIDAKVWKPGTYWTVSGHTFRGLSRFAPADKRTMPMAVQAIAQNLRDRRIGANIALPLLVVWPSSQATPMRLWAMRSPGARVVTSAKFAAETLQLVGSKPADPAIVAALTGLVIGLPVASAALPHASGF
jgi:hypothetical protein